MTQRFEDITTFNLDGNQYNVADMSEEAKNLFKICIETEAEMNKHKVEAFKLQHALASLGLAFRQQIKDLKPINEAANDSPQVTSPAPRPKKKPAVLK